MYISEAEDRLKQLLAESGFGTDSPHLQPGWEAFKRFIREPIRRCTEVVTVETGVDTRTGVEASYVRLSRLCEVNDEEKYYDHMEILGFLFLASPFDTLCEHPFSLSDIRFPSVEAFFTAVEQLPVFQAALAHAPWQCRVHHTR